MHPAIGVLARKVGFNPLAWVRDTLRMRELVRTLGGRTKPKSSAPRIGVVVTPWIGSAVPWFSLTFGLLLAANGSQVVFIVDDLPFGDHPLRYRFVLACIRSVVRVLRTRHQVIDVSAYRSNAPLAFEQRRIIERLARLNAVWALRGEMVKTGRQRFIEICERQLRVSYAAIATIVQNRNFDVLFLPGGVYGVSGVWTEHARAAGLRYASYDNGGYGTLMLAADGTACQLQDIPRAFALLKQRCAKYSAERKFVINAAMLEMANRRAGTDKFTSQMKDTREIQSQYNGGILIALNSSWDSAALGLHTVFQDNTEWIVETTRYLLENTKVPVIVRQHPAERLEYARTSDNYGELLRRHFGDHPRLHFVAANQPLNSYDLLDRVAAVVVYASTFGTEAIAQGKPVVMASDSYYSTLGFVWNARNPEQYRTLLSDAASGQLNVTQEMRTDALFCYYLTQCTNWIYSSFNPADFGRWSRFGLEQLQTEGSIQTALKSVTCNIPVSYLNHLKSIQAIAADS